MDKIVLVFVWSVRCAGLVGWGGFGVGWGGVGRGDVRVSEGADWRLTNVAALCPLSGEGGQSVTDDTPH